MPISNLGNGLRTGVCTSTNRPTTPYEGQVIYETDTDLSYIYNGSSWQQITGGTAVGNSGLVYVTSKTWTSTAAAQQIDNCFTSTYDNYLIDWSGVGSTVNDELLYARLVNGTTPDSSAIYYHSSAFSGTSAMSVAYQGSQTENRVGLVGDTLFQGSLTLHNPQTANKTSGLSTFFASSTNQFLNGNNAQMINNTTQYEGITLFPSTGTWAGTITVFGYRKA